MIETFYLNKQFDDNDIKSNFSSYFDKNYESEQFCKHLRDFSRIYQLSKEILQHVLIHLSKPDLKLENKIIFSQVVKYTLRKIDLDATVVISLSQILKANDNKKLQDEILQGLTNQIVRTDFQKMQSSDKAQIKDLWGNKELDERIMLQIKKLIQHPEEKVERFNNFLDTDSQADIKFKQKYARIREVQYGKQVHKLFEMQKQKIIQQISIRKVANSKFRQRNRIIIQEKLPEPIQNIVGRDRGFFESLYYSIQQLYEMVVSKQNLLKDEDEKFLTNILKEKYKKLSNDLQILIGIRMIISIFLDLSTRTNQSRQKISENTYQQIIQYCSNQKDIINMLFNKKEEIIYQSISKANLQTDKPNQIQKEALVESRVNNPQEFFNKQIDKLRCDAIQSILNLIQIQKLQIINQNLLIKLQENIKDQNETFKTYSFQLYTLLHDQYNCIDVVSNCFHNLINQNTIIEECCYQTIRYYIIDTYKCFQLFQEQELRALCSSIIIQEQGKLNRCQLLNICLENGNIAGLDEQSANSLIDELFKSNCYDVQYEIVQTIAFISGLNPKIISKNSANLLSTNINKFDGKNIIFKYIIIILGIISEFQTIESIDALSQHLINDEKVEDDDIQLKLEHLNIEVITVQFVVCHIILYFQQTYKILSKLVINDLVIALENENTSDHIKLLLARIMSNVDTLNLDQENLKQKIFVFIQDQNLDLAYSMSIVYTKELKRVSEVELIIEFETLSQCQSISNKFGIQECQITLNNIVILKNQINLTKEINYEQADVIKLILQRNDNDLEIIVLKLLFEFANEKILIHEQIIEAIQDLTNNQQIWIKLIESIINNGQSVTYLILETFLNFLYFDQEYSDCAFQILDKANLNQDLPEEIFNPLQIERAAYSITNEPLIKHNAIKYLNIEVQKGNKLTKNAIKSLKTELENDQVLDILIQISKTNQIIPNDLVEKMVSLFNPDQEQIKLIQIFIYISKNNQEINPELVDKLEKALDNNQLKDEAFKFFASYGQSNQTISRNVIKQIQIRLKNQANQELKMQLLETLISQIDKIKQDPIAIDIIRNEIIQELNVQGAQLFLTQASIQIKKRGCLNKQLVESLFRSIQKQTCSNEPVKQVIDLIPINYLESNQQDILELLKINKYNSKEFFKNIQAFKNKRLISQTFNKLEELFKENADNIVDILEVLQYCQNQNDIPQDLLDKIFVLSNTFSQDQYKSFQSFVFSLIKNKVNINNIGLEQILNCNDEEFQHLVILQVASYQEISNSIKQLSRSKHSQNHDENLVTLIEKKIQEDNDLSDRIINKYAKIIIENSFQNLELTITSLYNKRNQNQQNFNEKSILKCLSFASQSKNVKIEQEILIYFYENLINQKNDLITRSLSFRGLQSAIEIELDCKEYKYCQAKILHIEENKQILNQFLQYCASIVRTIEEKFNIKLELNFYQIEILIIIPQLDKEVITKNLQNFTIELLQQNLFQRFQSQIEEEQIFQENCKQLDQNLQNQLTKILQLLLSDKFVKFESILDILKFMKDMEDKVVFNILYFQNDPYQKFKYKWISKQLQMKFMVKKNESQEDESKKNKSKEQDPFKSQIQIIIQLPVPAIEKLLKKEGHFNDFYELLQFVNKYNLYNYKLLQQDQNINFIKLLGQCQKNYLIKQIRQSHKKKKKIYDIITILIEQFDWNFEDLEKLFTAGLSRNTSLKYDQQNCFIKVLQILKNFNISPQDQLEFSNIFCEFYTKWEALAYKCCLQKKFPNSNNEKKKNLLTLFDELEDLNKSQFPNNLIESIQKIKSSTLKSKIFPNNGFINNWKVEKIMSWAKKAKTLKLSFDKNVDDLIEAIAIIRVAILNQLQFELADNQLISAFLGLYQNKGTLLQVSTGQGKSIIICIIAILKAIEGKKVDIITSSPILAQRDAIQNQKLYQMFYLTCSNNSDLSFYNEGSKKCYNCDIVYGDVSQFQFDYLRDNFLQLNTLNKRSQDFVIVDEVDSMLIDESLKIARLSSQISGLDLFKPIYIKLWQLFQIKQRQIIKIDNQSYFFNGIISYNGDLITLDYYEDNCQKQISDLKQYLQKNQDITKIGRVINEALQKFMSQQIEQEIQEFISNLKIPQYFQSIVKIQLPKWINNLFVASKYKEKVQYIVQKGMIKPVDYESSGLILDSTNWQDGLHQFLQIKHNLRLTPESFTSNFLSNICYFKKYGSNIIGLSGTLGSDHAQTVLKTTYDVCILKIPDMEEKQFIEYPISILSNQIEQIQEICNSAVQEAQQDRAVLIISETINFAEKIYKNLQQSYESRLLQLYHMNNMKLEQKIQNISQREIIVATNLAGRGTDIKADQIQSSGGLHVILTFLPQNKRLDEQAFGRTSRKGQKGTGQMILKKQNLMDINDTNRSQLKKQRDEREAKVYEEFKQSQMIIIEIKDELFKIFNQDFNSYRKELQNIHKCSILIERSLQDIEEGWAIFLNQIENEQMTKEQAIHKYVCFKNSIQCIFKEDEFQLQNPYNLISIGTRNLLKPTSQIIPLSFLNKDKKKYFELAIKIDQENSLAAYFCLGYLEIKFDKLKAKEYLKKAYQIGQREINNLEQLIQNQFMMNPDNSNDLFKQLVQQINIFGTFCQNLKNNIKQIERSERLIRITKIKKNDSSGIIYQQNVYDKVKIEDVQKNIDEMRKAEYNEYEIMFRDLTKHWDLRFIDQADKVIGTFEKQQVKELSIESQKIKFNKIQSILKNKYLKSYQINLQFKKLNNSKFNTISPLISAQTIDIDAQIKYSDLQNALNNNLWINDIFLTFEEDDVMRTECKSKDQVLNLQMDANSLQNISIRNLNIENAKLFMDSLPNFQLFNFKFNKVNLQSDKQIDFNFKVEFIILKQDDQQQVIKLLREQEIQFCVNFKKLSKDQFITLIKNTELKQEQMTMKQATFFDQHSVFNNISQQERIELQMRGIYFIIILNEKAPHKWRLTLLGLGLTLTLGTVGIYCAIAGEAFSALAFPVRHMMWSQLCFQIKLKNLKQQTLSDARNKVVKQSDYVQIIQNYQLLDNFDFTKLKPFISQNIMKQFTQKILSESNFCTSLFHILKQVYILQEIFPNDNQIFLGFFKQIAQNINNQDNNEYLENWESITKSFNDVLLSNCEDAMNSESLTLIIQSEVNKNEKIQGLIDKIYKQLKLKLGRQISINYRFLKIIQTQSIDNENALKIQENLLNQKVIKQFHFNQQELIEIIDPSNLIDEVDSNIKLNLSQELVNFQGKLILLLEKINQYQQNFNIISFQPQIEEIATAMTIKIISILEKLDILRNLQYQNEPRGSQIQQNQQPYIEEDDVQFYNQNSEEEFEIIE